MKSRSKTFARKLIALFLAVIMACSCFTGAVTAFAASSDDYHDDNLAANFMAWAETTDDQTAEALLDWADLYLDDLILSLGLNSDMLSGDHLKIYYKIATVEINIDGYLDSVDGILNIIQQAYTLVNQYKGIIGGDVKNIDLSAISQLKSPVSTGTEVISKCGQSYRATNSAKDIILSVAKLLYMNTNDDSGKNVIGNFLKGSLNLGIVGNFVNVYDLLKTPLGLWDNYQNNLVYNIVSNLILTSSGWYSDTQIANYQQSIQNSDGKWVLDDQLFKQLSTKLLQQINAEITYPGSKYSTDAKAATDSSKNRYNAILAEMEKSGSNFATASTKLGYDPNLHYTDDGNVYLFQYGDEKLEINKNSKLLVFGYEALKLAWKTAIKPTLGLIHVNYKDVATQNYDNRFYYWMKSVGKWNEDDWTSNYTMENVNAWAAAEYKSMDASSADELIDMVKDNLTYDRTIPEKTKGNWRDINSKILFNELRYSPLADKAFNIQTGPINLYILQTGTTHIDEFFANEYSKYGDLASLVNDALVALVKDLFPQSKNIGLNAGNGKVTPLAYPELTKTVGKFTSSTDATIAANNKTTAETLVSNALKVIEYTANSADETILGSFYKNNNIKTKAGNLSEENLEEAMVPLLIACIQNIPDTEQIHDEKWDECVDAEGVAYVALEEYLSYVLPEKNYSQLVQVKNGKLVAGTIDINGDGKYTLFDDAILPMARDAVGYLLNSIVPVRGKDNKVWNVYDTDVTTDTNTIFDILNSVVCYYAGADTYGSDSSTGGSTMGKSVASILGAVDSNGKCLVTRSNTIWQNIDAIANNLLPVLGTLQYGTVSKAAEFSSYDLIYNKTIMGMLDIGPNKGVTNILEQILTIFTAQPIRNKGIDVLVYDDVLASLFNNLLGARYSGQAYKQIVPYTASYDSSESYKAANPLNKMTEAQSASPFDSFLQKSILAEYSYTTNKGNGVLGLFIENLYEFFAYSETNNNFKSNKSTLEGSKGCWKGAMFAVQAVNSFIPSFVPQLGEQQFNPATLTAKVTSASGVTGGDTINGAGLIFKNNSEGLNRFYKENGKIKQDKRYYVVIRNVSCLDQTGSSPATITVQNSKDVVVAPESSYEIGISGTYPNEVKNLTITATYDVFESTGSPSAPAQGDCLYTGLSATAYMYLSPEKGWADTLFGNDMNGVKGNTSGPGSYATGSAANANKTTVKWYNNFIIPNNNTSDINEKGIQLVGGSGYDAMFSYPSAGTTYSVPEVNENGDALAKDEAGNYIFTDAKVASGEETSFAYATLDSDLNLVNIDTSDIKFAGSEWDTNSGNGYTDAEIDKMVKDRTKQDAEGNDILPEYKTRSHIYESLVDAVSFGDVKGVIRDGNKIVSAFVDPSLVTNVTPATQISGISLYGATSISNSSQYVKWIRSTNANLKLDPQEFDMNLGTVANGNIGALGRTHIIISNNSGKTSLETKYNSYLKEMSAYDKTDFKDWDAANGYSVTYDALQGAFTDAVVGMGTPVTEKNAPALASTTESVAKTIETTSTSGDEAYAPLASTEALPKNFKGYEKNGYWYANEECTIPVYGTKNVTSVGSGKDAVGTPLVEKNGTVYVANTPKYTTEWTMIKEGSMSFPYRAETKTQDTNSVKAPLYKQVTYNYFNANNESVTVNDDWIVKVPIITTQIKPYDGKTDYRGSYQKYEDLLDYYVEHTKGNVDSSIASLIGEGVSEDRKGEVNVDYVVDTYEKKVQIAKKAEKLITATPVYVTDEVTGNEVVDHYDYTTETPSVEIREAKRLYDIYKTRVESRGFIGKKLFEEIKYSTGLDYTALSIKNDNVYGTANAAAPFGAFDSTGQLVNKGKTVYSDATWSAFTDALKKAITSAKGETDKISDTYTYRKNLMIATNNLAEPQVSTDIVVTGKVTVSTDNKGTASKAGVAGARIQVAGKTVARTDSVGNFTANIPVGTTEITVTATNGIARTVTLSGVLKEISNVNIGLIVTDYNEDGAVNATDALLFSVTGKIRDSYKDLNGDGKIDAKDGAILRSNAENVVNYSAFSLD